MSDEVKFELNKILNELPTENSWLDYKAKAYDKVELSGLINDLCAFLNSEQSYGKNKYIICGINDKNKDRIGIKPEEMLDDHYFQDAVKHIYPLPKIETGIFKHIYNGREYYYGYILICKDNEDRIYEIYNEHIKTGDNELYTIKEIYEKNAFAPIAWIRIGSIKDKLKETMRRKIYESDNLRKKFLLNSEVGYVDSNKSFNLKVIKTALLFGKWNEKDQNDKNIIEKFSDMPYEKFIEQFRLIAKTEKDFVFKNGVWKINNRIKYIEYYALDFYKEDFDNFNLIIVEILTENHPKLDLPAEKRNMYNIYNKNTRYSEEIRAGVAETLVIVEYLNNDFANCKIDASNFVVLVVRNILKDSDWLIWASLDNLLPFLAEAAPYEFLNQFKLYFDRDEDKKLFSENEWELTTYNYSESLYRSLELIAWNTDYCVSVCMQLASIATVDLKAINHIVSIILPWHANTYAPAEFKITIVENILKENIVFGWKILNQLMPGGENISCPTCTPKYINVPDDNISVTTEEYYYQIDSYMNLMLKYCKTSDERLLDLIDLLDNVSKENFDKICSYLKSTRLRNKSDSSRYKLWDKLESLIHWIKKHSEIKQEIKEEMIKKISDVILYIKPRNNLYIISRLFKKDNWELLEDYNNCEDSRKKLNKLQNDSIFMEYKENSITSIIELSKIVEDAYSLGMITANLDLSKIEEENIISNLEKDNNLLEFSKGYVYRKYNLDKTKFEAKIVDKLSVTGKVNFMLMLPYNIKTFEFVENTLKDKNNKYWKQVDIRYVENEDELKYCVLKLMKVKRYDRVLWMYRLSLYNNHNLKYDNDIVLTCLENLNSNFIEYDIQDAIKELQNNNADVERLFYIEWKYLPLLNHKDYRPITMEKTISSDPKRYSEMLELAFKEHSKKKDDRNINVNIATNAYRLLNQWKLVPGTNNNGCIESKILKKWYKDMKKICSEKDRLEVGLTYFGHVLFYSPKDKSNFWIDKTVAEILNGNDIIRKGYEIQAFNSVGVVNWDENGTDYKNKSDEYKKKAEDTELAGYYNFATTLRMIANSFEFECNYMKDTY